MTELLDQVEGSDAAENLLNKHKQITWSQSFLKEEEPSLKTEFIQDSDSDNFTTKQKDPKSIKSFQPI